MHTKNINGLKIYFSGPDLHQDEIDSMMSLLQNKIDEIENYSDKSLFFQNPQIFEGWLALVRAIEKIEKWEDSEYKSKWEDRTETYVAYLLTLRDYHKKYVQLGNEYYNHLKELLNTYGGWLKGECISADGIKILSADKYVDDIDNVEDIIQHLANLNNNSLKARSAVHSVLKDIFEIFLAVINRGRQRIVDLNPLPEDFVKAIDDDLREWTYAFGGSVFKDMKEDLNRHFKTHPTDHNTPELWGEMLRADEDALKMAMRQQLANCEDVKQEHWGEDMKNQMDENNELMRLIYSSCYTEEFFDINNDKNNLLFISLLTPDNLDMFYEIIVRRRLIQCEMFPELKEQHEKWLNNVDEQSEEDNETGKDAARQSKLNEIIAILRKGDWKQPATADNIEQLLKTVFGNDSSLLDEGDKALCEKMWALVEGGSGERMEIVPANLAGFFSEENLLRGTPKEISKALFGNDNQTNNINKGNSKHCSNAFGEIIPFLKKYIGKIIRPA